MDALLNVVLFLYFVAYYPHPQLHVVPIPAPVSQVEAP